MLKPGDQIKSGEKIYTVQKIDEDSIHASGVWEGIPHKVMICLGKHTIQKVMEIHGITLQKKGRVYKSGGNL